MKKKSETERTEVRLVAPTIQVLEIELIGTTTYIPH